MQHAATFGAPAHLTALLDEHRRAECAAKGEPEPPREPYLVPELRATGFRLFPLPKGAKSPPPKGFNANGVDYLIPASGNVGIDAGYYFDGRSLLIVDLDTGKGKNGPQRWAELAAQRGGVPNTFTVETPSGGRHLYFVADAPVRNGVEILGAKSGVDIRSKGGYVVGPGSHTAEGEYAVSAESERFPAAAPQWLVELCGQARQRDPKAREPLTGIDAARAKKRATKYLQHEAPPAVQGEGGDATAFKVAARVRDFGVDELSCLDLLWDHWNDRCEPPWTPQNAEHLRDKVRNAYSYANGQQGADAPEAIFTKTQAPSAANTADPFTPSGPRVEIVHAVDVKPEPIRWLWREWLARGKLHVIAGAPGTGKTTIALAWAAAMSAGRAFPDGAKPEPGHVVIWSGEDGFTDTLRPRLAAAGADLSRVHFIGDVHRGEESGPFDPARHVPALAAALAGLDNVAAIIVDPLVSAVSGDSHKNAEVRRGLAPLVGLAAKLDAALIGITHYSKGTQGREPLERVSGSLAFGALARLVFGTVRQTAEGDEAERRYMLLRVKSNIGPDGGGFGYTIEQCAAEPGIDASRIAWGGAIHGNARELLNEAEANEPRDHVALDAVRFIREVLADGPKPASEVKRLANEEDYAWRTIQRARKRAGVMSSRTGAGVTHSATWALASNEMPKNAAELFK